MRFEDLSYLNIVSLQELLLAWQRQKGEHR